MPGYIITFLGVLGYLFPIRDEKYFEEGLRLARMK